MFEKQQDWKDSLAYFPGSKGCTLEIILSFKKIEEKAKIVVSSSTLVSKEALRQRFKAFHQIVSENLDPEVL